MKIISLDMTAMNHLQSCARKMNLSQEQHLQPLKKGEALEKGDLMHKMLAPYYWGRLKHPKEHHLMLRRADGASVAHPFARLIGLPHSELVKECVALGREASFDLDIMPTEREETIRQFVEYAIHFAGDGWIPIEIEQTFSKILHIEPDVLDGGGHIVKEGLTIVIEGVVDLYCDAPHWGKITVDHKTTSRRENPSSLSNQFKCYSWALGCRTVIVNRIGFQKTLSAGERFQRIPINYATPIIDEWRYWSVYWTKLYQFYLENGVWPPNFTSCDKYSGCIYKPICEAIPEARDARVAVLFRRGKPWSPHTRDEEYLESLGDQQTEQQVKDGADSAVEGRVQADTQELPEAVVEGSGESPKD